MCEHTCYSWIHPTPWIRTSRVALVVYLFYLVIRHEIDTSNPEPDVADYISICTTQRSNLHGIIFMYYWLREFEETHHFQKNKKIIVFDNEVNNSSIV